MTNTANTDTMFLMTNATTKPSTDNATTQRANRTGAELASVWTDMLLAGNVAGVHSDYCAEVKLGYEQALASLIARIQANHNHYMATKFPTLIPDTIHCDKTKRGQRFVRIWSGNNDPHVGNDRMVIGFVEVETGLLWKAATWKAPAKNFPRGSMYDLPETWAVGALCSIG